MTEQPTNPDLWRVYRKEWVIVYSLNAVLNQQDPLAEDLPRILGDGISEYFERHYAGRVHDEDVRFGSETLGLTAHAQLELFLPNLKAEFKHEVDAWEHVSDRIREQHREVGIEPDDRSAYHVVQRNSTDDQELLSYGIRKLPTP